MICRQKKPDRSCAPVSPFTTHCGIQALAPERWWQFRASAVSAISVCSTRGKWDFIPSRSVAAKTRKRWPESWERTSTSIPAVSTPWQNCKNSEPRGRSLRTNAQRQSAVPRCSHHGRIELLRRVGLATCSYKHTDHTRENPDLIALAIEGISKIKRARGAALS